MASYEQPPFSGGTVSSLTDVGPLSATTGTFTGAVSAAGVSSSAAVTAPSVTATAAVQGATVLATSGLGVWGAAAPGAQPAAYTQAGPAASRVMAATTAVAAATTAASNVTPFGYTTAAQADAIRAAVNALITDHNALLAVVRQLVVDLKAYGLTA